MFLKKFVRDYLSFSRKDRIGLLALVLLILVIYLLPQFFSQRSKTLAIKELDGLRPAMDTLLSPEGVKRGEDDFEKALSYPSRPTENPPSELFRFNPNTLPVEGWRRLGLSEKTSKTIENYRNKGGRFHKPEDLKKIWGLPGGFYERVKDYISLGPNKENSSDARPMQKENLFAPAAYRDFPKSPVDINTADTTDFILLPGIGSKLASRIISFREKLGGFHSVEQVGETYGLADSVFQRIKPRLLIANATLRKINLNTATKDQLKSHPYFRWPLAGAIVEYRTQHGSFKTLDELRQVKLIDEAAFKRIVPYLEL
jgi:competence ComEA-like helix-hairpin-helix protein